MGIVLGKELTIEGDTGFASFSMEVADTEEKRNRGLMFRRYLSPTDAMLFVFDRVDFHKFWMKNTFIPLDLIFLDDNFNVVGTIENLVPFSEQLVGIDVPSRYALEVTAGTVKKFGIKNNAIARIRMRDNNDRKI